ncbi:hypothetical protein AAL_01916 [Moelleriella libera RCEF 2490]|uniref:Uncharacterized protein n=1 Tax=Moelleriella libera RCEF 2490 TaxID=1081109 RepID=A0A168F0K3_9HYPO|nr:hypothetical protein AAL_01916 [Moelleriella libera RCEF 2490]
MSEVTCQCGVLMSQALITHMTSITISIEAHRLRITVSNHTIEIASMGKHLSAAVDVYGEWVDAADAVAKADTIGMDTNRTTKQPGFSNREHHEHHDGYQDEEIAVADEEYS